MTRVLNENSMLNDKTFVYNLKVAEMCDFDRDSQIKFTTASHDLKEIAKKGQIIDFILSYLLENPNSKCGEIKDAYNNAFGLVGYEKETVQAISAYLTKLIHGGYVKRIKLEPIAIKISDRYATDGYRAILTTPVVFKLAE